jgi:hypothetical protein
MRSTHEASQAPARLSHSGDVGNRVVARLEYQPSQTQMNTQEHRTSADDSKGVLA